MRRSDSLRTTTTIIAIAALFAWAPPSAAKYGQCGFAATNGTKPVATDALAVLIVAVSGGTSCPLCTCDVNTDGRIVATDALAVLHKAVGLLPALVCPPCECRGSDAPQCAADCRLGKDCAPDPFDPSRCDCFTGCELSATPTCGGDCAGEPGLTCQVLTFAFPEEEVEQECDCAPPDLEACQASASPQCGGVCPPAYACRDAGGNTCACERLPQQGACSVAAAPTCGGVCEAFSICRDDGGTCACVAHDGRVPPCEENDDHPTCGGACPDGRACIADPFGDCTCSDPCEGAIAPACGEPCTDRGALCLPVTVTVGTVVVELCECSEGSSSNSTTTTTMAATTTTTTMSGFHPCEDSAAPTCAGECGPEGTCAPDPFAEDFCECLGDCQLSDAPTCGGDCGSYPGQVCRELGVQFSGEPATSGCDCLPEGAKNCELDGVPQCGGQCAPGRVCEDAGGSCACRVLPVQGPCAAAETPACGGTCPEGMLCEDVGDNECGCALFPGGEPPCESSGDWPTCGAACPHGLVCAAEVLGTCECLDPCEISAAPACGGACLDGGETCTMVTVSSGQLNLQMCACR